MYICEYMTRDRLRLLDKCQGRPMTTKTAVAKDMTKLSIVSGYGLDDLEIEVRSRHRQKNFSSSLCVQTGSGAHSASRPMGTGGPFSGGKGRPRRAADHHPI
jgi:hypothetical protein